MLMSFLKRQFKLPLGLKIKIGFFTVFFLVLLKFFIQIYAENNFELLHQKKNQEYVTMAKEIINLEEELFLTFSFIDDFFTQGSEYTEDMREDLETRLKNVLQKSLDIDQKYTFKKNVLSLMTPMVERVRVIFNDKNLKNKKRAWINLKRNFDNLPRVLKDFSSSVIEFQNKLLSENLLKIKVLRFIQMSLSLLILISIVVFYLLLNKELLPSLYKTIRITRNLFDELSKNMSQVNKTIAFIGEQARRKEEEILRMNDTLNKSVNLIKDNLDIAQRCQQETETGSALIGNASNFIKKFGDSMKAIKDSTRDLKHIILSFREIDKKSKKIGSIVSESRLLSFNAEIEAAHAGALGKGFSVVAEEMANLAHSSGEISVDISNVVVSASSQANSIIQKSKDSMTDGFDLATDFDDTFSSLENSFRDIFNAINEVKMSSEKQYGSMNTTQASFENLQNSISTDFQEITNLREETDNLNINLEQLQSSLDEIEKIIKGHDDSSKAS